MTDIMISNGRLKISDGDFVTVSKTDEVKQHIIVALNTFVGDWVLNREKGIDYGQGFRNPNYLENDIKKQVLNVKNVRSLDNFEMKFNRKDLTINVTATVKTSYGVIYLDETLYS